MQIFNKKVKKTSQIPEITFMERDAQGLNRLYDDVLVVKVVITNADVVRVLINNMSSVDIIFFYQL